MAVKKYREQMIGEAVIGSGYCRSLESHQFKRRATSISPGLHRGNGVASQYAHRRRRNRFLGLRLFPACLCCETGNVGSFCWGKALCACLAPFDSTFAYWRRMALRFADRVLGIASGNVHNQLCELVRIAGTFGHEASMQQAPHGFYAGQIQTETLPAVSTGCCAAALGYNKPCPD